MAKHEWKGRFAAYLFPSSFLLSLVYTSLLTFIVSLPPPHITTPCTTSLPAHLARSVVLRRRLPTPFSPVAPTRKLSFPTRAARTSSKPSPSFPPLLLLPLVQTFCTLTPSLHPSSF